MSAPVKDDQYVEYRAACPDHPGNEAEPTSIVEVARAGLAGPCCRIEQRIDDGEWVPVEECGACSATGWLPISAPVPGPVVNEVAEAIGPERDEARRRLAEVEAERDGVSMQNDLAGEQLREMAAERDRLAQEHDELLAEFHEYAEHQSWRCGHAPHYYLVGGEALESCPCGLDEVLARFPREGDGDDS